MNFVDKDALFYSRTLIHYPFCFIDACIKYSIPDTLLPSEIGQTIGRRTQGEVSSRMLPDDLFDCRLALIWSGLQDHGTVFPGEEII
ncbi:MAG: hypothetical protein ACE14P_07060 [Methanotrichaceae archaeon]